MGGGRKPDLPRADSSTPHYQTFPTKPPAGKGRPPLAGSLRTNSNSMHQLHSNNTDDHQSSPLPKRQLAVLAFVALAEQTALNSISPYLPDMASHFPDVDVHEVGLYVGVIASCFALAQFTTNFFWGWLSDRVGRKPVVMIGTLLTAACFVAFGFCRTLWQAIVVQALMGFVNGNQGVVSTCLGEITDRSNQSRAFQYLPVVYGIGGITGPLVGGLLVKEQARKNAPIEGYPYLLPNLLSAALLIVDLIIVALFLEESLEEAKDLPPLPERVGNMFTWLWQFSSSYRPSYMRKGRKTGRTSSTQALDGDDNDQDSEPESDSDHGGFLPVNDHHLRAKDVLNVNLILILGTFFIFQLSNIAYNSLYPIFGQAPEPLGRNLSPEEIGVSLGFAGAITILFQIGIFGKMRERLGNKSMYRVSLAAFVVAFLLMPWVGYKSGAGMAIGSGQAWLYAELGLVLIVKTVASVGGLTSALLLVTNSAPDHSVLGTLNGLAQTLSAAGRAIGPAISGGLFSLSSRLNSKGEAMPFGVFGGIAFIGFLLSFGIRGGQLEAEQWDEEEEDEGENRHDGDGHPHGSNHTQEHGQSSETNGLLGGKKQASPS